MYLEEAFARLFQDGHWRFIEGVGRIFHGGRGRRPGGAGGGAGSAPSAFTSQRLAVLAAAAVAVPLPEWHSSAHALQIQ